MEREEEKMTQADEYNGKNISEKDSTYVEPMGLDKVNTSTRLFGKHYSPLIVRKYQMEGWPLFVGLICDVSLSDLDKVVYEFAKPGKYLDDIQWVRNFCGGLSDAIYKHYNNVKEGCVEGIAGIEG